MKQLLILVCVLTAALAKGQFQVGHMSINFKDPSRSGGYAISGGVQLPGSGRDIGTEVYYPASTAGNNVALAGGTFPVVVIGHGFVMTWDSYDNIYNDLASRGYIVALPRTEGSFSPNHGDFGLDLALVAGAMVTLNSIASPTALAIFNGKIIPKTAIGGHSMGGGSSFLAAQSNASLSCLFNFAAAQTNPRSSLAAKTVTVPTLVISGARDCVADTVANQNQMYDSTASAKKFQVIFKGLTHCDFGNGNNTNCNLGQSTTGCGNQVGNALAFSRYMTYLRPFLDNLLKNDCAAGQLFMDSIQAPSSLRAGRKISGSLACLSTGVAAAELQQGWQVYPNPAVGHISLAYPAGLAGACSICISDQLGRVVYRCTIRPEAAGSSETLDLSGFGQGLYFLTVDTGGSRLTKPFVKW